MHKANILKLTSVVVLTGLLGCGREPVEATDEVGDSETAEDSESSESDTVTETSTDTDTTTETDTTETDTTETETTETDTETETETETDTTDTETDTTETETDTETDTETGDPLPCLDACGNPGCGDCPDVDQIDGPDANFKIDAYEATVDDYAEFLEVDLDPAFLAPVCAWKLDEPDAFEPDFWISQSQEHPQTAVTGVDWCDAETYCRWTGRRLCGIIGGNPENLGQFTNLANEWHTACTDEGANVYPYGDNYQAGVCNDVAFGAGEAVQVGTLPGCEGSLPGLFDMSGNVWEWTSGCSNDPELEDPQQNCRRRGGSFVSNTDVLMRCAVDSTRERSFRGTNTGIRCCAD